MTNTLVVKILQVQPHFLNEKNSAQQFVKAQVVDTKKIITMTLFDLEVYTLMALGTENPLEVEIHTRKVKDKNRGQITYYNVTNIIPVRD